MKVVGLTGSIAAGKNVFKDALMRRKSCYYVSLSTLIMEETLKKKEASDKSLQQAEHGK